MDPLAAHAARQRRAPDTSQPRGRQHRGSRLARRKHRRGVGERRIHPGAAIRLLGVTCAMSGPVALSSRPGCPTSTAAGASPRQSSDPAADRACSRARRARAPTDFRFGENEGPGAWNAKPSVAVVARVGIEPTTNGLRVQSARHLVAPTVAARLRATLGLLMPAAVMRAAQARRRACRPRTTEKRSHSGAQPSHLPVGSVASTRDNLIR